MISKNSFWASLKENNKRRIWVIVLAAFSYIIAFPSFLALIISSEKNSLSYMISEYGEQVGNQKVIEYIVTQMKSMLGVGSWMLLVMVIALAVVSAIQGYSYLYHKNKIDFYLAMPVKKSSRFFHIWLNGILVYLIPSFLSLCICYLIVAGNHALTGELIRDSLANYAVLLLVYLGCYHMTMLAVMMTGHVLITCLGTGVFFLYELIVRMMIQSYQQMFFIHYSYYSEDITNRILFSPIFMYVRFTDAYSETDGKVLDPILQLIVFAGVLFLLAYLCYRKRPAEAAGRAMAFHLPEPIIKILIAVPCALIIGEIAGSIAGYNPLYEQGSAATVLVVMAVAVIFICCLMQVLYEFDIKGILHRKADILISAVLTVLIFLGFRYDVTGYDTYIPKAEKVENAVLYPSDYDMDDVLTDNLDGYVGWSEYLTDNLYLTDIGTLNELMKQSIALTQRYDNKNDMYLDESVNLVNARVAWRMQNKKVVYRQMQLNMNDEETIALLSELMDSEDFVSTVYEKQAERICALLQKDDPAVEISSTVETNDVVEEKLPTEQIRTFLSCYMEDLKETTYQERRSLVPSQLVRIRISNETHSFYKTYYIYPVYERCMNFLKENGYDTTWRFDPSDIEKIRVINYNFEETDDVTEEGDILDVTTTADASYAVSTDRGANEKTAVYDAPEDIEEICRNIFPGGWNYSDFYMDFGITYDYDVMIYFKADSEAAKDGTISTFAYFIGEAPAFVQEDVGSVQ